MVESTEVSIDLEQLEGLEFRVSWDWDTAPPLLVDEPAPVGRQFGPNATRLVAAAVGDCLSASLAFCLHRSHVEVRGLKTRVALTLARNERGRLRIGDLAVRIELPPDLEPDAVGLERCLGLFEDYCVVTESIRRGIPVGVEVVAADGSTLRRSGDA
jgi:uncharacterized OsmC-like protein